MALIGISGSAQVAPPPNRPTMTSLPPLLRQSKPSCVVLALPTRSITARIGPAAFLANCSSASAAPPSTVASAPACSAASRLRASIFTKIGPFPPLAFPLPRVDINDDGALAAHRLEQRQRHQAKAARTENDDRRVEGKLDFLQCAVGGDAGARVRRGGDGIE